MAAGKGSPSYPAARHRGLGTAPSIVALAAGLEDVTVHGFVDDVGRS